MAIYSNKKKMKKIHVRAQRLEDLVLDPSSLLPFELKNITIVARKKHVDLLKISEIVLEISNSILLCRNAIP
jgi:hypothetical protein